MNPIVPVYTDGGAGGVDTLIVLAFLFAAIPALLAGPLFLLLVVIRDTFRGE